MGTNTIAIEASLDSTNADSLQTFTADKQIRTVPVTAGIAYRAVVSGYTSGSPVVKCTIIHIRRRRRNSSSRTRREHSP